MVLDGHKQVNLISLSYHRDGGKAGPSQSTCNQSQAGTMFHDGGRKGMSSPSIVSKKQEAQRTVGSPFGLRRGAGTREVLTDIQIIDEKISPRCMKQLA